MNKPDETTLNRWLNGELEDAELHAVEAWAEQYAGDLDAEFKCNIGWSALCDDYLKSVEPSVEPPYPEFFNSKILQMIEHDEQQLDSEPANVVKPSIWQKFRWSVMPAAAAALVAFFIGMKMAPESSSAVATGHVGNVYVPLSGVAAAVMESDESTEIILEGLAPIADDVDIAAGERSATDLPYMMANSKREMIDFF